MNANISWRRNPSLSPSPAEDTRTLMRYSPATPEHGCPSISLSLLSRTLMSQQNQAYAFDNVTAEQFAYLMQYVEAAHGAPRAPKMLHVFSTDPDVLNRRSKEQFGAMDSMFAIGAMPDWIPADIRRASLRGQIHTELSPPELEKVAATRGDHRRGIKKERGF